MARKRTIEEGIELDTSARVQPEVEQLDADSTVAQAVAQEPDEQTRKVLESYPNYPALYIDAKGGVFLDGTPAGLVGNATLYQNPYYKS